MRANCESLSDGRLVTKASTSTTTTTTDKTTLTRSFTGPVRRLLQTSRWKTLYRTLVHHCKVHRLWIKPVDPACHLSQLQTQRGRSHDHGGGCASRAIARVACAVTPVEGTLATIALPSADNAVGTFAVNTTTDTNVLGTAPRPIARSRKLVAKGNVAVQ